MFLKEPKTHLLKIIYISIQNIIPYSVLVKRDKSLKKQVYLHTKLYLFLQLQKVRNKFACKNTHQELLNDRKKAIFLCLTSCCWSLSCKLTW